MLKNLWRIQYLAILCFLVFLPAQPSDARLRGLHAVLECIDCHLGGFSDALFDQEPNCVNAGSCHDGVPTKSMAPADASQLFGTYTFVPPGASKGTSHAWGVPYNNASAGASYPSTTGQTRYGPGNLGCSSCHYPHYYLNNYTSQPLLKRDNREDQLCLDCHRARNVQSASVIPATGQRSHPVGVPVPATTAFNDPSINPYGVAASDLRLLGAGNKVSCSTCHGVHYADSNPWTENTFTSVSGVPNGKGVLLRRYNDDSLCQACHNFQGHAPAGQMLCRNCHDPHLGAGTNLRLIYPVINSPRYGNRTTVMDNLSTGLAWRSDGKIGICEACHTINPALQPYSTPFPNWSSKHKTVGVNKSDGPTLNCFACHGHQEGPTEAWASFLPAGAEACSACHGYPPSANTFGGPSGYAEYSSVGLGQYDYLNDGPASPKDESSTPHKRHALDYPYDQGSGAPGPSGQCYACHAIANHQDGGFQDVVFGLYTWGGGTPSIYDGAAAQRTCTDVYCHSDGGPNDVVDIPQTEADWDIAPGTFGCNDCHLNPPITNRHTPHAEGIYNFGCINCHTNTVSDNTTIANEKAGVHVNRVKNVDFGNIAATSGLQSYSTSTNTCQDVWCHGEFPNGNQGNNPDWDVAGGQGCGEACHALPPVSPVTTHARHVTDYGFDCAHCHGEASEMAFGVVSAINNYSSHVNGVKNVKFQDDGFRDIASGSFNSGTKKCGNIYCHSNGQVTSEPFFVNVTAWWEGTMTCKNCHGNNGNDGDYKRATPLYTSGSPKENSHDKHVIDNDLQCQDCHFETVNADNISIKNYTAHVNGNYNIDIALAYDSNGAGTPNYNLGSKQCSGIKCHGDGTPTWGTDNGTIVCESCHGSGADVDDFVFQSFSGIAALIDSADYTNTGHGKATGNYPETGLPAANRVCLDCHDENVSHGDATNPFRLMTSNADQFCLGCHGDAGDRGASWNFNGMSSIDMQSHTHANISSNGYIAPDLSDNWRITPKCVDCHDPHGDSNLAMVHDKVATKGSNVFGIPSSTYFNASTVVFTGFTENVPGTFSYDPPSLTSICRACHSVTRFHQQFSNASALHNNDLSCVACHKHETGFTPAGCNGGCHGFPPTEPAMLVYSSGTDTPGLSGTGSTTEGAHDEHYNVQGIGCQLCHSGGMQPGMSEDGDITLEFAAYGSYTTGVYDGQTSVKSIGTTFDYNGAASLGQSAPYDMSCNNVKCHGASLPNGNGLDIAPVWNSPATGDCGNCHGVKKVQGSGVGQGGIGYPNTNGHAKHAGYGVGQYDFMCKTCHSTTVLGTSTTLSVADHVNAEATISLYTSDSKIATTATYRGDVAIASGYGDCTNTYCHSMGNTTTVPFATPFDNISWMETRQCNTCHGNGIYSGYQKAMPNYADGAGKFNRHSTHVVANNIECVVCHNIMLATNSSINDYDMHVNKEYNVDIMTEYNNIAPAFNYDQATVTCTNTDCHGENTIAWGDTGILCQNCHFSNTADADNWTFGNFSTAVAKIYSSQWAAEGHGKAGISKQCTACHDTSVAHNNGTDYFRLYTSNPDLLCLGCHGSAGEIAASAGWNGGGASKTDYQTHSWANISTAGYGRDPLVNISGAANNGAWTFTPKCVDCHDPHGDTNVQMIQTDLNILGSDSRGIPLGNTSTVDFTGVVDWNTFVKADMSGICQRCHDSAVANFDKNSFSNHNAGSKCTGCHKHSEGFKPSACDGCHGTPPVDPGTLINDAGKTTGSNTAGMHATHVGVYTGSDNCNYCHQDGMNVPPNNFNNVIDLKFDAFGNYTTGTYKGQVNVTSISGDYNYGGPAAGTADGTLECSSVKCHGAGLAPLGGNGLNTAPFWNVSSTGDCGNCHGVKKVTGTGVGIDGHGYPDTGAHAVHAGYSSSQGQYDFMCKTCHDTTVLGTSTTLESTTHVNGRATIVLDADMDRIDAGATYRGDDTIGSGYGDCTNTYCHSMGNTTTVPFATPFDNISWMETRQCNTCHGNGLYSGYTSAMPDYGDGTPKANKHDTHVRGNGIECRVCHYATTEDSTSIADASVHVNRLYNLSTAPGYDNDGAAAGNFSYNGGTKTCSNIDCHGENDVAWDKAAATIVCQDCHLDSATDVDDWAFANFSGAVAKIWTSEWASRGHGLNSGAKFAVSSSVGADLGCGTCHDGSNIAHGVTGEYFRLYTSNTDGLCLGCHGTGGELGKSWTGGGSTLEGIQTHSLQNMSTAGYVPLSNMSGVADWNFTPRCVDCHDPHGDGNNYMIHDFINYSGSDSQGRPTNGASKSVSFSGALTWDSYVNAGFTGLCQGCHDSKVANFDKGSFNNSHNPGSRCTQCHKHGEGFKPSGCNVCHGNGGDASGAPPESPGLGYGWLPDTTGGGHPAHVGVMGILCYECHNGAGNGQEIPHATSKANANLSNLTGVSGHGDWYGGAKNGNEDSGTWDDRCSNIDCHGGRAYKRLWDIPTDCDDCHGNRNALSNYSAIRTGSHVMHTYSGTDNSAGYNFVCTECHVNNAAVDHYDSVVDLDFSAGQATLTNYSSRGGASFSFEPFTTTENSGTCQEAYCHGGEMGAGSKGDEKPQWGNTATAQCGDCHITSIAMGDAVDISQGAHTMHVTTYGFSCSRCHASETARTHVNGEVTFNDDTDLAGTGVCLPCHFDGVSAAKTGWPGKDQQGCSNCHNTAGADVDNFVYTNITGAGMVAAKINMSQYSSVGHGRNSGQYTPGNSNNGANQTCTGCHDNTVVHGDVTNPFRLYSSDSVKLCSICHDPAVTNHHASDTTDSRYGFEVKCVDCHDPHGDNNIFMIHSTIEAPNSLRNYTASDQYGRPFTTASSVNVDFTDNADWTDYGNNSASTSGNTEICNVCHTRTGTVPSPNDPRFRRNMPATVDAHFTDKCTDACHTHDNGFEGAGESQGDTSCGSCHSTIFSGMGQSNSYHHVMQNASAYAGDGDYPMSNNIDPVDSKRRCLMCHADHNVFSPANNPSNGERAKNLRINITTVPLAGSPATFADSDFIMDGTGGICMSCHSKSQTKNITGQLNDGSQGTLKLVYQDYSSSPHNYEVSSEEFGDNTRFKANCVKCHNDTMTKTKYKQNAGPFKNNSAPFSLHDSELRRINSQLSATMFSGTVGSGSSTTVVNVQDTLVASDWIDRNVTMTSGADKGKTRVIGTNTTSSFTLKNGDAWDNAPLNNDTYVIGDPPEQDYCFNCHGNGNPNLNASPPKDYYGVAEYVNTKALRMEPTFSGDFGGVDMVATTTDLFDTNKTWVPDLYKNFTVKITSTKLAGIFATISSNTTNTLYFFDNAGSGWSDGSKGPVDDAEYSIGNPFRHRIGNFGGIHESDEAISAPSATTTNGWFADIGGKPHVGCQDCHNPHAQRKPATDRGISTASSTASILNDTSKSWSAKEWVGFKLIAVNGAVMGQERVIVDNDATNLYVDAPFTGADIDDTYYYIYPLGRANVATLHTGDMGNMLNGPNNGQWGVGLANGWSQPTPSMTVDFDNISAPAFSKITSLTAQSDKIWNLCLKCHSEYGWGSSGSPFDCMDCDIATKGAGPTTDISAQINPNNLAHHALADIGENQPITASGASGGGNDVASTFNTNWPKYEAGTITGVSSGVATFSTTLFDRTDNNMPHTAIPGWYVYFGTPSGGETTGWYQISEIVSDTQAKLVDSLGNLAGSYSGSFFLTAGLGNNFVPPYGPWSLTSCADCHDSDGAADPKGPHGSGQNWLLRGFKKRTFSYYDADNTVKTMSYGPSDGGTGNLESDNSKILCLNCHRADVYGFNDQAPAGSTGEPADGGDILNVVFKGNWARQTHTPDVTDGRSNGLATAPLGIHCKNCHTGGALGEIHGTNQGVSLIDAAQTPAGSPGYYRGKRFLTGSAWTGVRRGAMSGAGTCYNMNSNALNTCGRSESGTFQSGVANYDYETNADF